MRADINCSVRGFYNGTCFTLLCASNYAYAIRLSTRTRHFKTKPAEA